VAGAASSRPPLPPRGARLEDDTGGDAPCLDVRHRVVHLVERPHLARDARLARRVQLEHLAQVGAGAHDRADDGDAVEHGLEDRDRHGVVRGKGDEDQRAEPCPEHRGPI
jgi:hypothetical protein